MKFCTWHDNCSDTIPYNGVTLNKFSIEFELRWKIFREMGANSLERWVTNITNYDL